MTREQEIIQSLPPRYQHRMAELAFAGWKFRLCTVRELVNAAVMDFIDDDRKILDTYVDTKRWSAQHDDYYSQHAEVLETLIDMIDVAIAKNAWRVDCEKLLEKGDDTQWLQEMKRKSDKY